MHIIEDKILLYWERLRSFTKISLQEQKAISS